MLHLWVGSSNNYVHSWNDIHIRISYSNPKNPIILSFLNPLFILKVSAFRDGFGAETLQLHRPANFCYPWRQPSNIHFLGFYSGILSLRGGTPNKEAIISLGYGRKGHRGYRATKRAFLQIDKYFIGWDDAELLSIS